MIDASSGFIKDGNKNRLREQDIHKITDAFTRQAEIPRLLPPGSLRRNRTRNDFNLNIPRYIDGSDPEDLHDIEAHLRGGMPQPRHRRAGRVLGGHPRHPRHALSGRTRARLFRSAGRAGGGQGDHPQPPRVRRLPGRVSRSSTAGPANAPLMDGIADRRQAQGLIHTIAEDMLTRFADAPLIDRYEVYQRLMSYWAEAMQDDVFIIATDGWVRPPSRAGHHRGQGQEDQGDADLTVGTSASWT